MGATDVGVIVAFRPPTSIFNLGRRGEAEVAVDVVAAVAVLAVVLDSIASATIFPAAACCSRRCFQAGIAPDSDNPPELISPEDSVMASVVAV